MKDSCENCKFTIDKTGGSLVCQRFPNQVRVAKQYWCGEWRPEPRGEKNGNHQKPVSK